MIKTVLILLMSLSLFAQENDSTCKEKKEMLQTLKSENVSTTQKGVLYALTQSVFVANTDEDKQRKEKIRILEMEIKMCNQEKY